MKWLPYCLLIRLPVYFLYPETANVRLEDMNELFGDATTAMPTPATQAVGDYGSPVSMRIAGTPQQPGRFGTDPAIPGLDIDPPDLEIDDDGKPIRGRQADDGREGLGGWIGRMVSQTRNDGRRESRSKGQYGKIGQDDD